MMRARSPLAMQQQEAAARQLRGATVTSVAPDPSLTDRGFPRIATSTRACRSKLYHLSNASRRGFRRFLDGQDGLVSPLYARRKRSILHDRPSSSIMGTIPEQTIDNELLAHPETVVIFPLCWQACLFGSALKFDKSYDLAHPQQLISLRTDQKRLVHRFVIAPRNF